MLHMTGGKTNKLMIERDYAADNNSGENKIFLQFLN